MWLKLLLGTLFILSLVASFLVEPAKEHTRESDPGSRAENDHSLRLLTWNVGNGDLESETRAHADDLPAVARVILDHDSDAVALQELTGNDQLKLLLQNLRNRYTGYVCSFGGGDRVEAVLVKKTGQGGKDASPGEARATFSA